MPQFVVVGAGPAGCTAALRAVRTPDAHVAVIEKRSFETIFSSRNSPRSYPMVLSGRALRAFEELELDLPSTREPYHGIQFMPSGSKMSMPDPKRCCLVSRSQLALNLMYEVASHPNISLHFSSTLSDIDITKQCLTLQRDGQTADDSLLVLQHLIQEEDFVSDSIHKGALLTQSQPLDIPADYRHAFAHANGAVESASESEAEEPGLLEQARHSSSARLSVLSGEASISGSESEEHTAEGRAQALHEGDTRSGDHRPAADDTRTATRPALSSTRMTGMQAALAVQAKQQTALPEKLNYDLLIGADGSNSKIRHMLVEEGILSVEEVYSRPGAGYKTLTDVPIPASARSQTELFPFVATELSNQQLFFITGQGDIDIKVVLWRSDSDHVCGMVPGSSTTLSTHMTPEWLEVAFGDGLPEWLRAPFCEQVNAQAVNPYGHIRRCSQMHAPGVVLLGDSAHSVTSGLGQGCNMALESVRVFGRVLEECMADPERSVADVPVRFTAMRQPDVLAMQRLEHMHMVLVGGAASASTPAGLPLKVHVCATMGAATLVGMLQWKLMPATYRTVPLFDKLYDEQVAYADVLQYVNGFGRGTYVVVAAVSLAIGYNLVRVVLSAVA